MSPYEIGSAMEDFMVAGGDVLWWIAILLFVMWTLIIERFWYARTEHLRVLERVQAAWESRTDTSSWHAQQIRRALIWEVSSRAQRNIGMIQTLVALCPLLGLLGTVTGMIEVFDIMAITGSSSARAMASGITKATIPTMAGMVAALSGLYFSVGLKTWADEEAQRAADLLVRRD